MWQTHAWWAQGAYCLSYDNAGVLQVYELVRQDGTTSGQVPVPGNGRCIDGDMIWMHTAKTAAKEWKAQTQFFEGDIVSHAGNNYECVFDGRLEMPGQINLENITTNMKDSGDVFAFWEQGTDVPTKLGSIGKWEIKVDNVDCYRFRTFTKGYFGHAGNPAPTITECGVNASGGSTAINAYTKGETDALIGDKAPLASPALTGKPTAPTAAKGTNDTQIANTAFVAQTVAALVNSAPVVVN